MSSGAPSLSVASVPHHAAEQRSLQDPGSSSSAERRQSTWCTSAAVDTRRRYFRPRQVAAPFALACLVLGRTPVATHTFGKLTLRRYPTSRAGAPSWQAARRCFICGSLSGGRWNFRRYRSRSSVRDDRSIPWSRPQQRRADVSIVITRVAVFFHLCNKRPDAISWSLHCSTEPKALSTPPKFVAVDVQPSWH